MSYRDFEVYPLYLREQLPQQVCAEMGLTQVQFSSSNQEQRHDWRTGCRGSSSGTHLVNNDDDGFVEHRRGCEEGKQDFENRRHIDSLQKVASHTRGWLVCEKLQYPKPAQSYPRSG